MKLLILVAALFAATGSKGNFKEQYAEGYIISKGGDSFSCKIRMPMEMGHFNEMSLFFSVLVLDSNQKKVKFKPKDIKGFGFIYNSKKYIYLSKVVDDENNEVFVWPVQMGRRINEYYYYSYNSSDLQKGSMGQISEVYVLEDDIGQTVSITRGGSVLNTYKSQLRKFFQNDKKVLQLISEEVKDFHDIPKMVQDANKP